MKGGVSFFAKLTSGLLMRASLMFEQSNEVVGFHFPVVYIDKMSVCIHADLGDIGTIIPGLAHSTFNKSK
jgi:hypothetical protein